MVKQEDGTYRSSPFHVRFGKFGVFKSRLNVVDIEVNNRPVENLHMKLGEAGEAFFVETVIDDEEDDICGSFENDTNTTANSTPAATSTNTSSHSIKSDATTATSATEKKEIESQAPPLPIVDDILIDESKEVINKRNASNSIEFGNVIVTNCTNIINLPSQDAPSSIEISEDQPATTRKTSLSVPIKTVNYFSDGELTPEPTSPIGSRPSTPKSDTEIELQKTEVATEVPKINTEWNWNWGELPEKTLQTSEPITKQSTPVVKKALPINNTDDGVYLADTAKLDPEMAALYINQKNNNYKPNTLKDEDQESGSGHSIPHSPVQTNMLIHDLQISLCGGLQQHQQDSYEDLFQQHIVLYERFQEEICTITSNPNLVIKLNGRYLNWPTAAPIILSALVFQKPISNESVTQLAEVNMPKPKVQTPVAQTNKIEQKKRWGLTSFFQKSSTTVTTTTMTTETAAKTTTTTTTVEDVHNVDSIKKTITATSPEPKPAKQRRRIISTRLSSDFIKKLNLNPGSNVISYSVTTAIQGTTRVQSFIFLWNYDDKIVVSDIDGTITRSDVMGQILPMFGRDWSQQGIADLFSAIERNSYKFIYLSARAIGQSKQTRELLRSVNQDGLTLPNGPLFVTPASLFTAFQKEVIEKNPQEFKIRCLEDLKSLFPRDRNPFYAGYGNRVNDVISYKTIGIPLSRIFTINPRGELKHEVSQTFQTSYTKLCAYVDQIFPPINQNQTEFSSFSYWKDPLPMLDFEEDTVAAVPQSPAQTLSPSKKNAKKVEIPSKPTTTAISSSETTTRMTSSTSINNLNLISPSVSTVAVATAKPVQIPKVSTSDQVDVEICSKSL